MIININDNTKADKHIEKINKSIIISAFSCLGKTYLGQNYKDILDLEASLYKWIYFDEKLAKEIEKRKGIKERKVNPNWPQNYLEYLSLSFQYLEKVFHNFFPSNHNSFDIQVY